MVGVMGLGDVLGAVVPCSSLTIVLHVKHP